MLYFRDKEMSRLSEFASSPAKKAMAVYGRRRIGKTELILEYIRRDNRSDTVYFQCTSFDYNTCLGDFLNTIKPFIDNDPILDSLRSFKDIFSYVSRISDKPLMIVIDEFPFLCKRNDNAAVEFQWIIDHGMGESKLVLLGSNLSFMQHQITDAAAPLYGRFDEILEMHPFTFAELNQLFGNFEDAVDVYAQTGGVAQYVMFYKNYGSVAEATAALYFNRNGRLFQEAGNMLMQELRDITTYVSILRALSSGDKDSGQIAHKAGLDPRGIFSYLNKLIDLGIVCEVTNPLSAKKRDRRYRIVDALMRFSYTFIEPNASIITALGPDAIPYVLGERYNEYLGSVYEDIIRAGCYEYALHGTLPFMPMEVGKWWGNVKNEKSWHESEVDVIAYDSSNIVIGECKYRNKAVGIGELNDLKAKTLFIPTHGRKIYYLLASKSGFTDEVKAADAILIDQVDPIKS